MPKITKVGGFTDITVKTVLPDVSRGTAAEEESWPGNSSETSQPKPQKTAAPRKQSHRKPAPTTASRSKKTAASNTARSAGTNGPETGA